MRSPDTLPDGERDRPVFVERLRVPVRWWVGWSLMVSSFWLAMIVAVPERLAWIVTAILALVMVVLLRSYGSPKIMVTTQWIHAGRARIQRRHLGPITALDAIDMRSLAGPKASARAYLLLRPYISTGVRIDINDPQDPTPYWLLSSRQASALASVLGSVAPRTQKSS